MNTDKNEPKVCPLCGKTYTEVPALSRKDNTTPICPDCGTRESLEAIGIPPKSRKKSSKSFMKSSVKTKFDTNDREVREASQIFWNITLFGFVELGSLPNFQRCYNQERGLAV